MNLRNRLTEYIRACFTGIWIESYEHQKALVELAGLCRDEQWQLATWDIDSGLNIPRQCEVEVTGSAIRRTVVCGLHQLKPGAVAPGGSDFERFA